MLSFGALVAGCDAGDEAEGSSGATTRAVAFQADTGTKGEELLDLGGLTLRGYCRLQGGRIHLSVTATTATEDAVLGSRFSLGSAPYTFVLDDFDPSFGEYDVMGKASDETAGTLTYMPADGGPVVVHYAAAQDTAQGDCTFGGLAIHGS